MSAGFLTPQDGMSLVCARATACESALEGGMLALELNERRVQALIQAVDDHRLSLAAQNAPVQGTAADIFKLAMIDLDRELEAARLESRMVLTVHDELVLEVPLGERDTVEPLVRSVMESAADLRVPLVVDVGFGPNWADAK